MAFGARGSKVRSLLVALGLGAIAPACKSSHASFPDADRGHAVFSPDRRSIVVTPPHRLIAYDLDGKRAQWERPVASSMTGVAFSPSGTYLLLVEKDAGDRPAKVSLLRASDGAPSFTKDFATSPFPDDPETSMLNVSGRMAPSDDGSLVAFLNAGFVEVYAAADGALVFRDSLHRALDVVVFQARSTRFAFATQSMPTTRVVDRVDGKWAAVATFDGTFHPSWTKAGLTFGSDQGLELWDGSARRVVLAKKDAFYTNPVSSAPVWLFSSDGDYVATWNLTRVTVRRVSDASVVATREESGGSSWPIVVQAAFVPGHFRAFLHTGDFIDIALDGSSAVRRKSFGSPGSYSRNLFNEGSGYDENYRSLLSLDGRYVDIYVAGSGHKIQVTE